MKLSKLQANNECVSKATEKNEEADAEQCRNRKQPCGMLLFYKIGLRMAAEQSLALAPNTPTPRLRQRGILPETSSAEKKTASKSGGGGSGSDFAAP